ncbi:hypothetical protein [Actinoplanes sp. L3-i22]|uniref:hypothetical protein n=1 Tax=Actinoplanes sp. L3-i22 TaxID=2836373 RepID=UPI001C75573E|nr:hypothetical protein [Actinoplanes sp. L3-i22]BCY06162.1 hypothetical protein L3i22_012500 [Actinoplanes sp. L3-i22]
MPTVKQAAPTDLRTFFLDLSALLRDRPALSATATERADWFDRKAELLESIAATTPEAAELAITARETATWIRGGAA